MGDYKTDKVKARFFGLKLNRVTDADIIAHLESQSSFQTYLKRLIRADIDLQRPGGNAAKPFQNPVNSQGGPTP